MCQKLAISSQQWLCACRIRGVCPPPAYRPYRPAITPHRKDSANVTWRCQCTHDTSLKRLDTRRFVAYQVLLSHSIHCPMTSLRCHEIPQLGVHLGYRWCREGVSANCKMAPVLRFLRNTPNIELHHRLSRSMTVNYHL